MSKDRLLSDEELQAKYLNMFRGGLEPLAKAIGSQEERFDELVKALAKGASAIANTQKRLYAESVIGEDELHKDWCAASKEVICVCGEVVKRELRAEQRASL